MFGLLYLPGLKIVLKRDRGAAKPLQEDTMVSTRGAGGAINYSEDALGAASTPPNGRSLRKRSLKGEDDMDGAAARSSPVSVGC